MCNCNPYIIDLRTPRNALLTAFYKRSFAHHTVKNRIPVILTHIIDSLVRNKEQIEQDYGEEGQKELKEIIGEISKLKYEVQTNKPFRKLYSRGPDVAFYNKYIDAQFNKERNVTFFSTLWLLCECYVYRRVRESFELANKLQDYDPFLSQKQESFINALPLIISIGGYLTTLLEQTDMLDENEFTKLLKITLWGNKCDLSFSDGKIESSDTDIFNIESLDPNILCDHSENVWSILSKKMLNTIDIVSDNAGVECFTDFCLADYMISKKLAGKVRFYIKTMPWFISDINAHDFYWTLCQLKHSDEPMLAALGEKWTKYVKDNIWIMVEDGFWTLPVDFSQMAHVSPGLYNKLAEADLILFKGDLNYRKLVGDRNWDPTTPIDVALNGFNPSRLCALRTIKSDTVCGLPQGVADKIELINEKWMESGDYALIQCSEKVIII